MQNGEILIKQRQKQREKEREKSNIKSVERKENIGNVRMQDREI